MNAEYYNEVFQRELQQLHNEVLAYETDELLWQKLPGIHNTGGNLCLHLIGNLNHFIGATLGKTEYVRNRDAEFGTTGLSKHELLVMLNETQAMVQMILPKFNEVDMGKEFPFDFLGKHATRWYLNQFVIHFNYHLGQLNYHRRIAHARSAVSNNTA
jgi:hypothetical protein